MPQKFTQCNNLLSGFKLGSIKCNRVEIMEENFLTFCKNFIKKDSFYVESIMSFHILCCKSKFSLLNH